MITAKKPLNLKSFENFGKVKIKTPKLLMLRFGEIEITFFQKGKILIKNSKDADEAEELLLELFKKANLDVDEFF